MKNFYLDGNNDNKSSSEIHICKAISSDNNCCSETDEIILYQQWNKFTKPKLEKHKDDVIDLYKKFFRIAPFVKTLEPKYISYHTTKYRWVKEEVEKCFDAELFVTEKQIQEMIQQQKVGKSWNKVWAERFRGELITELVQKILSLKIMGKKSIYKKIVLSLTENSEFYETILKAEDILLNKSTLSQLSNKIIEILQSASNKMNIDSNIKKNNGKFITYINENINVESMVQQILNKFLQEKLMRQIKESTASFYVLYINSFFESNQGKLFKSVPSDQRKSITAKIKTEIEKNQNLHYYLSYLIQPENFKSTNDKGSKAQESIKQILVQLVKNVLKDFDFEEGIYQANVYTDFLKELKKQNIFDQLYKKCNNTVQNLMIVKSIGELLAQEYDNLKNKKQLTKDQQKDIDKYFLTLWETIRDSKNLNSNQELKDYTQFSQLINKVKTEINTLWKNQIKSALSIYNFSIKDQLDTVIQSVYDRMTNVINNDAYIPLNSGESDKQICAIVVKHNLIKVVEFNENKMDHCKKYGKEFFNTNIMDMYQMLESVQQNMNKLYEMKKSLSCYLCNSESHQFFKLKEKNFQFSNQFCFDLISQYKDYFKWKNIDFQTFLENTFQYLSCFDSTKTTDKFPYQFLKKNEKFDSVNLDQCLKISKIEEISKCQKFCDDYSLLQTSHFIEGDVKFLKRIYDKLLTIIRQYGFQFQLEKAKENERTFNINTNISLESLQRQISRRENKIERLFQGYDESKLKDDNDLEDRTLRQKHTRFLKQRILSSSYRHKKISRDYVKKRFLKTMKQNLVKKKVTLQKQKKWNPVSGQWEYTYKKSRERELTLLSEKTPEELMKNFVKTIIDLKLKSVSKVSKYRKLLNKIFSDSENDFIKEQLKKIQDKDLTLSDINQIQSRVELELIRQKQQQIQIGKKQIRQLKQEKTKDKRELVKEWIGQVSKGINYTEKEFNKIDEISQSYEGFQRAPKYIDFRKFEIIFDKQGLNPLLDCVQTDFSTNIEKEILGEESPQEERVNNRVIRNYLLAQKDIHDFNNDLDIELIEDVITLDRIKIKVERKAAQKKIKSMKSKDKSKKIKKMKKISIKKNSTNKLFNMLISLMF